MDLEAVRAFVTVAEEGQFQLAAVRLEITQQAVSNRLAPLESDLGVRLFTRTVAATQLTIDGQVLLPHARQLLRVEQRAADALWPARRALRVDVLNHRTASSALLRPRRSRRSTAHIALALNGPTIHARCRGAPTMPPTTRAPDVRSSPGASLAASPPRQR